MSEPCFDVVCGSVIADLGGGGVAVEIDVSAELWTWSDKTPAARAGKSRFQSAQALTWSDKSESVRCGVFAHIPPQAWIWADRPEQVSISALIAVNPESWSLTDEGHAAYAGKSARVAHDSWTVAQKTPRSWCGVFARVSPQALTWSDKSPRAVGGRTIYVPVESAWSWSDKSQRATGGVFIGVFRTVLMTRETGSVADGVVAEFTQLDADPISGTFVQPDRFPFSDISPIVWAGKSRFVPHQALTWADMISEIESRSHRLVVFTTLS